MSADAKPSFPQGTLPWTRSCFVCGEQNPHGLRLRSRAEGDRVVLDYTPREADVGYRHIVHGGIGMTLVDEVMTWAAILHARRACVAAEIAVRLRRPLRVGQPVRVEGWIASAGSRLIATEGRILDAAGAVLVTGTGKYMPMASGEEFLSLKDFVVHPDALPPDAVLGKETP
jgi:uncharacterized protein (TIGR00369 family)